MRINNEKKIFRLKAFVFARINFNVKISKNLEENLFI